MMDAVGPESHQRAAALGEFASSRAQHMTEEVGSQAKSDSDTAGGVQPNCELQSHVMEKKPRRVKPDFPTFLADLKRAVACESRKQRHAFVLRVIKVGYKGSTTPSELDLVFNVLKSGSDSSSLALSILIAARSKKPAELIRFLRTRFASYARTTIGYPPRSDTESQDERRDNLLKWLAAGTAKSGQAKHGNSFSDWERWVLVSLIDEPLLVRTDSIYALLDYLAGKLSHLGSVEARDRFAEEVMKLIGAEKINSRRIASGLTLAIGARACSDRLRDELMTAESSLHAEQSRNSDLSNVVKRQVEELRAADASIAELKDLLRQKSDEVEKEKQERTLDGEHWQTQSQQRLSKMANGISRRLSHEIREAKLCLDGDSPNLQMALDRLAQMEEALAKLKESDGGL